MGTDSDIRDPANEIDSPFPETADIETSSDDYATRFSGSAGRWMLSVQERITLRMLDAHPDDTILDVGGGHGQLAIPLYRKGHRITVVGSHQSCRQRLEPILDGDRCEFDVGNVIDLPYEDNSFDTVICFRLLTHCTQWPRLVGELCRIARRAVIADYPTSQSLNCIAPALFGAKKRFERNTRTWRLFRHDEVLNTFRRHGYVPEQRDAQFFLPMVLHRAVKFRTVCASLEWPFRAVGLTRRYGSPVIVEMRREQRD